MDCGGPRRAVADGDLRRPQIASGGIGLMFTVKMSLMLIGIGLVALVLDYALKSAGSEGSER